MSSSQIIQYAASRCPELGLVDLRTPFGNLLTNSPVELAKMPGSPSVVMMAQCLSYLKSNYRLREPFMSDQKAFNLFAQIILNTPESKTLKKG